MASIWRTVIFISLITGAFCQDDFLVAPKDQTVEVGSRVVMGCQINVEKYPFYALGWYREGATRESIYMFVKLQDSPESVNVIFPEEHEVEKNDNGEHNLIIKSAKLEDGMAYSCESIHPNVIVAMRLVVIEIPVIQSAPLEFRENTATELTCEGRFGSPVPGTGNGQLGPEHQPFIQGYIDSTILDDIASPVEFGDPGSKPGTARYRGNVTITAEMDQKLFLCEFRTEIPYFYVKAEEVLVVHHAVSVIEMTPLQEVYLVGDSINCSANGNPPSKTKWHAKSSHGAREVNSPTLEILENMIGDNIWYCRAQNQPVGLSLPVTLDKDITFQVEPRATETPVEPKAAGSNVVVIVVVCVLAVLIIVGAAVGFYCYKSKSQRQNNYDPRKASRDFNLESDMGDIDDSDAEIGSTPKTKPKPESRQMLPPPLKQGDIQSEPEKVPLKMQMPAENGEKSSRPTVRDSQVPPTPPPPLEEAALNALLNNNKHPASGAKAPPVIGVPPEVSRKPTPRARMNSQENMADRKPPVQPRKKDEVEGTSV